MLVRHVVIQSEYSLPARNQALVVVHHVLERLPVLARLLLNHAGHVFITSANLRETFRGRTRVTLNRQTELTEGSSNILLK